MFRRKQGLRFTYLGKENKMKIHTLNKHIAKTTSYQGFCLFRFFKEKIETESELGRDKDLCDYHARAIVLCTI